MNSPAYSLAQDPAYLAFLRASGLQESVATADAARRRDGINQALGLSVEDLDANGEQARKGISASQEDRGVFRSGQTLTRMSDQEEDQARRRSAIELAGAGQLGDLETSLATQIAGNQTKGAEYGLSLAGSTALDYGMQGLATDPSLRYTAATPVPTNTAPGSAYRRKTGTQEF